MNFELVSTEWHNKDEIRLPDYRVGRVYFGSGRSYLRINLDGTLEQPFRLYTSLTTAIDSCQPTEYGLLSWYCQHGLDEANRLSKVAQTYGSLFHVELGIYLTTGRYNFDTIPERVAAYLADNKYWQPEVDGWAEKLRYDVMAFIAFAQEHEIQPLGVEYVLLSERGFGTMIDLVCRMKVSVKGFYGEVYKTGDRKGQAKETTERLWRTAVINFKSGRHGFYRNHGIQIACEKLLWEENFPGTPIDCAMNWSPKEWTTEPSWNLKDWTGEIEEAEIDAIMTLAQIRYSSKAINKKYITIQGEAVAGQPIAGCISMQTVEEYARERYSIMTMPAEGVGL